MLEKAERHRSDLTTAANEMEQAFAANWQAETVVLIAKGVASLEFATLLNTTHTNTQPEVLFADFGHYTGKE